MLRKITTVLIALSTTLLTACAGGKPVLSDTSHANDPYEGWNRGVFAFNNFVDKYTLSPVAQGYNYVTPKVVRNIVSNELDYIQSPVSIANAALQGDWEVFKHVTGRFMINTFFGGLGMLDAAHDFGFPVHREDFGQTLAVWGVPDGRYYMAPLFGSLTLRDVGGKITDYAFDPLTYSGDDMIAVSAGRSALGFVEFRARNFDTIEGLKSSSEDYYATVRSIYLQKRNSDIMNEDLKSQDSYVDFSAED